jgi:hypothetical protein
MNLQTSMEQIIDGDWDRFTVLYVPILYTRSGTQPFLTDAKP